MVSGSMNLGYTVSADCSSCIGSNCVDVSTGVDGVGGVVGTDSVADRLDGLVGSLGLRVGSL